MHKIFAGPMGIIPKARNTIWKKKRKAITNSECQGKQATGC